MVLDNNEAKVALGNLSGVDSSSSVQLIPEVREDPNKTVSLVSLEEVPQGRHLGLFSTIVLFTSRILGSGIFSISSGIYEDCGRSVALFFLAWSIGFLLAISGLYVFLELGSMVPRSGGMKVFLEFIYERPKYLSSVTFLVYSVIFGFTISNCLVFGEYFLHALGAEPNDFRSRITGLLFLYFAAVFHGVSVGNGVRVQNIIGAMKLVLMLIMLLIGFYVVCIPSSVSGIENNLDYGELFHVKKDVTASTFAGAVIKVSFAFGGWNSVHTVANEIKDPIRTLTIAGPAALISITVTYFFTNWAYLVAIPGEELANSGNLVGAILFEKVLGHRVGKQFLTMAVAVCSGGNIFVVIYTISRVSQEVFREGYLPFSGFMASNKPFGSPLHTLVLSCSITTALVFGIPNGNIYNYIVSLEGYPLQIFVGLNAVGIFIIERRFPEFKPPIRAPRIGVILVIILSIYLLIYPILSKNNPNPRGTEGWPSFALVGFLSVLFCMLYWLMMFKVLPWLFNYTLEDQKFKLEDGLVCKKWVKTHEH